MFDPANNQQVTDLEVVGESLDPTKVETPVSNTGPDANGIYHVKVKGKATDGGAVRIRARRAADNKDAGTTQTNVLVLVTNWAIAVNRTTINGGQTATVTLTATGAAGGGLEGIDVSANFANTVFQLVSMTGTTNQNGIVTFTVQRNVGNVNDTDTLHIFADGWNSANDPVFTYGTP